MCMYLIQTTPSAVDDRKVSDNHLRVMLRDARSSKGLISHNVQNHPVRKYYQLRAALSTELNRYQANRRRKFEMKIPDAPSRLIAIY